MTRGGRAPVAVTGVGLLTPAGRGWAPLWSLLASARSAAGPVRRFDPTDLPVRIAAEVPSFDPAAVVGPKEARRTDRATQLGLCAALDALSDAGNPTPVPERAGIVTGTGIGGVGTLEEQIGLFRSRGPDRVSPLFVPMIMANATAALLAIRLGWTGPTLCLCTACAAGAHAIGEASRLVADGTLDVALAGGTEAAVTPPALAAFARMGALSRRPDPAGASRPFDADRDGFVLGEGAGFVVLERLADARARGARVHGVILGYARNTDAHHITAPAPGGAGAAGCMRAALADAGLRPGAVTHVNAHGTSTPHNDLAEAEAIRAVFGPEAPPVTSVKGAIGHLIGAAGAVEVIVALDAATRGLAPPTANHERTGPGIALDVVAAAPRPVGPGPVLTNSFGFGGHNATLVVGPEP